MNNLYCIRYNLVDFEQKINWLHFATPHSPQLLPIMLQLQKNRGKKLPCERPLLRKEKITLFIVENLLRERSRGIDFTHGIAIIFLFFRSIIVGSKNIWFPPTRKQSSLCGARGFLSMFFRKKYRNLLLRWATLKFFDSV